MTPLINGNRTNDAIVNYFNLGEYVEQIKLKSSVLDLLQDVNTKFKKYLRDVTKFDEEWVIDYFLYHQYNELNYNQKIENMNFDEIDLLNESVFFDTLNISNKRIHELHNFAVKGQYEPTFDYRKEDVNVSYFEDDGTEVIYWRGADYHDLDKFMSGFIKVYKHTDLSILMTNPFLRSALMHLLFLRIHPYTDGNGRTARLIHNMKFTESINKIYGTKLRISPINLSGRIYDNKISYVNYVDNIYFDLEHSRHNYEAINDWFRFILYMADEQMNYSSYKLEDFNPKMVLSYEKEKILKKQPVHMLVKKLEK